MDNFRKIPETDVEEKLDMLDSQYASYLHFAHHQVSSVIGLEAFKFSAINALPQITQAIAYLLCCFLTAESYARPIVVYKYVATIYRFIIIKYAFQSHSNYLYE